MQGILPKVVNDVHISFKDINYEVKKVIVAVVCCKVQSSIALFRLDVDPVFELLLADVLIVADIINHCMPVYDIETFIVVSLRGKSEQSEASVICDGHHIQIMSKVIHLSL